VLRSFGYYDALPEVRIADLPIDARELPERLAAIPAGGRVAVALEPDPGPRYRLGAVSLEGELPPEARAAFDLTPGAPARAADVLAAGEAVLAALRETGHALARVPPPDALVDHGTRTLDVTYRPEPGPWLALGNVAISGLERLREGWVRRRLGLVSGEPYSPSRLEAARRSLLASGAVAWARLTPADAPDAGGRLPLTLELAERPSRSLRLSGAYSSDEGLSASASWLHRKLWGGAEQLGLRGEIRGLADGGVADLGGLDYLTEGTLRVPDLWLRNLDLRVDLGALSESPDAYDREAVTAGLTLERRFSDRLLASTGVAWERSRIAQDGPVEDYRLLMGLCCSGGETSGPGSADGPVDGSGEVSGGPASRIRCGWGAGPWGAALFADAGAVSRDGIPGTGTLAAGVGVGLRCRTPVGPLRVDLATPLNGEAAGAPLQLYIGIGQAF
jgi:translocation and assembly module TamA